MSRVAKSFRPECIHSFAKLVAFLTIGVLIGSQHQKLMPEQDLIVVSPKGADVVGPDIYKGCYTKHLTIDKLYPEMEFRPDWYKNIGYMDVEDRRYLLPFLLADRIDTSKHRRRILIDLGGNLFETSALWFLQYYPAEWDEIYVFEVIDYYVYFHSAPDSWIGNNTLQHDWRIERYLPPLASTGTEEEIGARIRSKLKSFRAYVDLVDLPAKDQDPMHINITRFLRDEIKLSQDDFVVMKHDIEGMEYKTIPSWIEDGTIDLIDEMFIEVHYGDSHVMNGGYGWINLFKGHYRADAMALFEDLRDRCVFAHPWP
mmetsp:Transcript_4865/g.7588  ORF Transcript_4865/g.7588 Transcript_4865/m.7588 type:complete len:314 (+) Transcript_4865:88-1029(+)